MNNMDVLTCVVFKNLFVKDKKKSTKHIKFYLYDKIDS